MGSTFDEVLADLRALGLDARLQALYEGRSDVFREGFEAYVAEIGGFRDLAKMHRGANEIDGMYLPMVANNMKSSWEAQHRPVEWHEGLLSAMWLLLGAYLRDLGPLPRAPGT